MHKKVYAPDHFFPAKLFVEIGYLKFVKIPGGDSFFPGRLVRKAGIFHSGGFIQKFISHGANP
jgi:hypothetical protein